MVLGFRFRRHEQEIDRSAILGHPIPKPKEATNPIKKSL